MFFSVLSTFIKIAALYNSIQNFLGDLHVNKLTWSNDGSINSLTDYLNECLAGWIVVSLSDKLIYWLTDLKYLLSHLRKVPAK